MRFYKDIITAENVKKNSQGHYHEWTPQSIELYWSISANDSFIRRQFYPKEYWEDLLAWAAKKITTSPLTIVDVGCGSGNLIDCISKVYRNACIYGVDLSEDSLIPAKERFKNNRNVRFKVGSLDELPFEDRSVDFITCTEVLEHTFPETFKKSFFEVKRILKDGGYYLASIPFDEKIVFVCCPSCGSTFTPYQHMMFEISYDDILRLLSDNGLELIDFYQALDRTQPNNYAKQVLKSMLIKWLPSIAARFFPKTGVSGFLASTGTTRLNRDHAASAIAEC